MARTETWEQLHTRQRQQRNFSEELKRKKVSEIERNLTTVSEVCREYEVSATSVRRWLYKYSKMRKKGIRQIVEAKSDTRKLQQLKEQVRELERMIGQKQIQIDFMQKMIELAEAEYGVDIKKKFDTTRSSGTGSTGKNTTSG